MKGYKKMNMEEIKKEARGIIFPRGYIKDISVKEIMKELDINYRILFQDDNADWFNDFIIKCSKRLTYNLELKIGEVRCKRVLDELYEGGDRWS